METTSLILAVLLGFGLSASTGLNTFLPLLLLGGAVRFGIAPIELNDKFNWLTSDTALIVLIIACIVELVADKIPAVDHFLDGAGTFVRPLAGIVAMASVLTGVDPMIAAVVGLILGAPTSFGFHSLKAGTRVASSATTFGCANPVLSLLEDLLALVLSIAAIFAPIFVPILIALFIFVLWKIVKRLRQPAVV
ncbi:MAG TPA: DUF4126 domain-containing protein [Thermoanaerobaculia bacterium]